MIFLKTSAVRAKSKLILFILAVVFLIDASQASTRTTAKSTIAIIESLLPQLSKDQDGIVGDLEKRKLFKVASSVAFSADYSNLPRPPDTIMKKQINQLAFNPPETDHLYLVWFPYYNLGGIYTYEGSGACVNWLMFTTDQKASHQILTPSIFNGFNCSRDGIDSYVGVFNNHIVAIVTRYIQKRNHLILKMSVQEWNGKAWGNPECLFLKRA